MTVNPDELVELKQRLLRAVSASLIAEPKFYLTDDPTRQSLLTMVNDIIELDAEFPLKVALYARDDLGIRSTANFLLAAAAVHPAASPFVRKYFPAAVRLPSDWLNVAELVQTLPMRPQDPPPTPGVHGVTGKPKPPSRPLPAALRRAMVDKFATFTSFSLAKYDNEGAVKKRKAAEKKAEAAKIAEQAEAARGRGRGRGGRGGRGGGRGGSSAQQNRPKFPPKDPLKPEFTFKELIRQLHIGTPADAVMGLMRKRYPDSEAAFHASGLPGDWDEEKAGTRMRLPIPETWETQVSANGNVAATWEKLLDNNSLPFMAMLRNLRNLIHAGVSQKHHEAVQKKLRTPTVVINSRQFPFRFFTAYDVLDNLQQEVEDSRVALKEWKEKQERLAAAATRGGRAGRGGRGGKAGVGSTTTRKSKPPKELQDVDPALVQSYKSALDEAIRIATNYNVAPVRGSTLVLVNMTQSASARCKTANALGSVAKNISQVSVLLGLMTKHVAEDCRMMVFGAPKTLGEKSVFPIRNLSGTTILDNMAKVMEMTSKFDESAETSPGFPLEVLEQAIISGRHLDNIVVVSTEELSPDSQGNTSNDSGATGWRRTKEGGGLAGALRKYREAVNPNALFVSVNVAAGGKGVEDMGTKAPASRDESPGWHPNNVVISGFSDAILRYLAERGDAAQLSYVEHIDTAKKLRLVRLPFAEMGLSGSASNDDLAMAHNVDEVSGSSSRWGELEAAMDGALGGGLRAPVGPGVVIANGSKPWKVVRVFVSSTFMDMEGERDYLAKTVWPELTLAARKLNIHFSAVDLRWGLPAEDSFDAAGICLQEVLATAPLFVGLLGERYGWIGNDKDLRLPLRDPRFAALREYPSGRSVTELEVFMGALASSDKEGALICMRDPHIGGSPPNGAEPEGWTESDPERAKRLADLKKRVIAGLPKESIFRGYKSHWKAEPFDNGRVGVTGLEELGKRVREHVLRYLTKIAGADEPVERRGPLAVMRDGHERAAATASHGFVGRARELEALTRWMGGSDDEPLIVTGEAGAGKSALLAAWTNEYAAAYPRVEVLRHFVGSGGPGSADSRGLMGRLIVELVRRLGMQQWLSEQGGVPSSLDGLQQLVPRVFEEAASRAKVLIVLDGVDELANGGLEWMPAKPAVRVVMSVRTGPALAALKNRVRAIAASGDSILGGWDFGWASGGGGSGVDGDNVLKENVLTLGPLSYDERKSLVEFKLALYGKKLGSSARDNQMRTLATKRDAGMPLFLAVAVEELRVWGSFEGLSRFVQDIPVTLPAELRWALERMGDDVGLEVMKTVMTCLVVSRGGVSLSVLWAVLAAAVPGWTPAEWPRFIARCSGPAALTIVSGGNGGKEAIYDIAHASMAEVVEKTWLLADSDRAAAHRLLADVYWLIGRGESPSALARLTPAPPAPRVSTTVDGEANVGAAVKENSTKSNNDKWSFGSKLKTSMFSSSTGSSLTSRFGNQSRVSPSMSFKSSRVEWKPWSERTSPLNDVKDNRLGLSSAENLTPSTSPSEKATVNAAELGGEGSGELIWDVKAGRALSELSYHLGASRSWARLGRVLTDIGYVHACASSGALFGLLEVYGAVGGLGKEVKAEEDWLVVPDTSKVVAKDGGIGLEEMPDGPGKLAVAGFGLWIRRSAGELASWPEGVLQSAANRPDDSIPSAAARALWAGGVGEQRNAARPFAWLEWMNKPSMDDGVKVDMGGWGAAMTGAVWSPSGDRLLLPSEDHSLKMVDSVTGKEIGTLIGHSNWVMGAEFSPDGSWVISVSWDGSVRLWDGETGAELKSLRGHTRRVSSCSWSPDSRHVASAGWDAVIRVWSVPDGKTIRTLRGGRPFNAVSWSPNEEFIAGGLWDGRIAVWETKEWRLSRTMRVANSDASIRAVAFSPDSKQVIAATMLGHVRLFNVKAGTMIASVNAHSGPVNGLDVSPDGKFIVSSGDDSSIKVWKSSLGKSLGKGLSASCAVNAVRVSRCGTWALVALHDGTARVLDVTGLVVKAELVGHDGGVVDGAFGPLKSVGKGGVGGGSSVMSRYAVTGSEDGTVRVWEVDGGGREVGVLTGHEKAVTSVDTRSALIAAGGEDWSVRVWKWPSKEAAVTLRGHNNLVTCVRFGDEAGSWLVSGSRDNNAIIWGLKSGSAKATLRGHKDWVNEVSVNEAGDMIASASWDFEVRVWSVDGNPGAGSVKVSCLWRLSEHLGCVTGVSWVGSEGDALVSGGFDGTMKVWKIDERGRGTLMTSLAAGGEARVSAVSGTPATKNVIASATDEGEVRFWNAYESVQVSTLVGHGSQAVSSVSFKAAATSSRAGSGMWGSGAGSSWLSTSSVKAAWTSGLDDGDDEAVSEDEEEQERRQLAKELEGVELVSAGADRSVKVWKARGSGSEGRGGSSTSPVVGLETHQGGTWMVSASRDGDVTVWRAPRGQSGWVASLTWPAGGDGIVNGVALAPTSVEVKRSGSVTVLRVAVATSEGSVRIWETEVNSGQPRVPVPRCVAVFEAHKNSVASCVVWLSEDRWASGGWDGCLTSGGVEESDGVESRDLGINAWITALSANRESRSAFVGFSSGMVCGVKLTSSGRVDSWEFQSRHQGNGICAVSMAGNHIEAIAASADVWGQVTLWRLKGAQMTHVGSLKCERWSSKGAVVGDRWWDAGETVVRRAPGLAFVGRTSVPEYLMIGSGGGEVAVVDVKNSRIVSRWKSGAGVCHMSGVSAVGWNVVAVGDALGEMKMLRLRVDG